MSEGGDPAAGGASATRLHGKAGADSWAMPKKNPGGGRGGGGRGGGHATVAKIATPHGGADVTRYLKKGAPKPVFKKSRAPEPTVDQIQVRV